MNPVPSRLGRILVNHVGFLCEARKTFVIRTGSPGETYEVQNMALNRPATMTGREDFQAVFTGRTQSMDCALGAAAVGDFSAVVEPGIYRIVLPETGEHSYQFMISDGAFSILPEMFLRWTHAWRSGNFTNAWRGPSHLDDGIRTDTGEAIDATGGWCDAGDARKWMVHSNLPALALMNAHEKIPWHFSEWEKVDEGWTPWLHEARWGLDFILKMQDPESGMFYEDVGGGRNSRWQPGMSWWYANHSGCYADNADNRFTDNIPDSGDERPVRIQYNPTSQFTNTTILARAARVYSALLPDESERWKRGALQGWELGLNPDPHYLESPDLDFSAWTSVRAWRCLAAVELGRIDLLSAAEIEGTVIALLENFDSSLGFWRDRSGSDDPFRGILHSAQPLLALCAAVRFDLSDSLTARVRTVLQTCLDEYVHPLCALTAFRFVPFGVYREPDSEDEVYRPWRDGLLVRFVMPVNHREKINHGLMGHWMSWAHALAETGVLLGDKKTVSLAWDQIYWATGNNPYHSTVISGIGFNNPMPHSRLLGTYPGGFCVGFCGSTADEPFLDMEGDAQWCSTEYWTTPLSNAWLALGSLLPVDPPAARKLGTAAFVAQGS